MAGGRVHTARGDHQRFTTRYYRLFMMSVLLLAALSVSQCIFAYTAFAQEPDSANEVSQQEQAEVSVMPAGPPEATSKSIVKPSDAVLRWSQTATDTIEDSYDIRVASSNDVDINTSALMSPILQQDGLVTPEYDVRSLTDGTYYWQVRSCDASNTCSGWSSVFTVTIDGSVPGTPLGKVSSGVYSQTVTIDGTAEPASTIVITIGERTCNIVADSTEKGNWSCTFDSEFEYGDYTALIKSSDAAGNESSPQNITFTVNELFIAPQITIEELPAVLEIVPITSIPENKTELLSVTSSVDPIYTNVKQVAGDSTQSAPSPLSDGGIIQPSESGWQIIGLPWFVWLGMGAGVASLLWALGWPSMKRMTTLFSPQV